MKIVILLLLLVLVLVLVPLSTACCCNSVEESIEPGEKEDFGEIKVVIKEELESENTLDCEKESEQELNVTAIKEMFQMPDFGGKEMKIV